MEMYDFNCKFLKLNCFSCICIFCFRKMEIEIVSMIVGMLYGSDECVGFLIFGGIESNLMVVKVYLNCVKKMYFIIKNLEIVSFIL